MLLVAILLLGVAGGFALFGSSPKTAKARVDANDTGDSAAALGLDAGEAAAAAQAASQGPHTTIISSPKEGTIDLLDVARDAGLTRFVEAVEKAGLAPALQRPKEEGLLTVFAPTNATFERLEQHHARILSDPARLKASLMRQMVTQQLYSADLKVVNGSQLDTLGGKVMVKRDEDGEWTLDGQVRILIQEEDMGGGFKVTDAGIIATNGVIQPVTGILGED